MNFAKFEITNTSSDFISNVDWLDACVEENDMILCGVSALEYLELFSGYTREKRIDVYAKKKGNNENIRYHILNSFNDVEYDRHGKLLCCTFNQVVNDMLKDFDNADELALSEALANYYFAHNESFDGLEISTESIGFFEKIKDYAVNYYYV